jgi:hypothetical protein
MRILIALLFVMLALYGQQEVLAAEEGDARVADPNSPLIDEHAADYAQYTAQYYARYHEPTGHDVPGLTDFRAELDPQGRPKWFDGYHGENAMMMLLVNTFLKERFDDLERLVADWNNPDNRFADGRFKLRILTEGLKHRFAMESWDSDYQIIKRWRAKYPQSAGAAIAEAEYWYDYAWDARGHGYSDSVSKEGWKLFGERLHIAEKTLLESEDYASTNPAWYVLFLHVAEALQWPKESFLKFSDEGSQKYKYYYGIYFGTVEYLTPKWGGDWKLVDDYIKGVVEKTKDTEGNSMYARLYWAADCNCGDKFNLFHDTLASWPKMKKGFEDIMKLYPHSAWNLNQFASYACQAGDKETFQSLRFRIGKNVTPEVWRSNYSLDLCEHQFPEQPL